MTAARVYPFPDRRSEQISVPRAALSAASESALAASRNAADALERALGHVWSGHRAGAVHELERAGFELEQRLPHLLVLTRMAEDSAALTDCPDHVADFGHGKAS